MGKSGRSKAEPQGEGMIEGRGGLAELQGLHALEKAGEVDARSVRHIIERDAGIEKCGEEVSVGLDGEGRHEVSIRYLFVLSSICLDILNLGFSLAISACCQAAGEAA